MNAYARMLKSYTSTGISVKPINFENLYPSEMASFKGSSMKTSYPFLNRAHPRMHHS